MSEIFLISTNIIMVGATIVIATSAIINCYLAYTIRKKNEQYEQQMRDLLSAIVISNMVAPHGGQSTGGSITKFKAAYKGKTKIFD
jgi:multisubunit Na+/H+ antiporter MnhB subunit